MPSQLVGLGTQNGCRWYEQELVQAQMYEGVQMTILPNATSDRIDALADVQRELERPCAASQASPKPPSTAPLRAAARQLPKAT